jgi:hypothetical protein
MIMMDLMSVRFGMIVTHFSESVMKACEDAIGIGQDLVIPEAQDAIAQLSQGARALFVFVFVFLQRVLAAIDLNNKALLQAGEVDDIGADRDLLAKMMSVELATAQQRPDFRFRISHLLSKSTGAFQHCRLGAQLMRRLPPP